MALARANQKVQEGPLRRPPFAKPFAKLVAKTFGHAARGIEQSLKPAMSQVKSVPGQINLGLAVPLNQFRLARDGECWLGARSVDVQSFREQRELRFVCNEVPGDLLTGVSRHPAEHCRQRALCGLL